MTKFAVIAALCLLSAQAHASDPMIQVGDGGPDHVGLGLGFEYGDGNHWGALPSTAVIEVQYSGFGHDDVRYFKVSAQASATSGTLGSSAFSGLDVTITPITWSSEIANGRAERLDSLGVVHAYRDTAMGLDGTITIVPIAVGVTNENNPDAKVFYRAMVELTGFQVMQLANSYSGFTPFAARVSGEIGMNTRLAGGPTLRFTFVGGDASLGWGTSYGEVFSRVALILDRVGTQLYVEGGARAMDASSVDSSGDYTIGKTAYGYLKVGVAGTF